MLIRRYKGGWMDNASIVGFVNIIGKENVTIEKNYIEFDHNILKNFQDYYFKFFMSKYDRYTYIKNKLEFSLDILKKSSQERNHSKNKLNTKILRDIISVEQKKLEKSHKDLYAKIKELLEGISKSNDYAQIEANVKDILGIFKLDEVNQKLTLNKMKAELQRNFFGQVSFLNVCKSGLSLNETKSVMFKDYVYPVLLMCEFEEIMASEELIKLDEFINLMMSVNEKDIQKDFHVKFKSIIKGIDKLRRKESSIEKIKDYVNTIEMCELCSDYKAIGVELSESIFALAGVSNKNAQNFFWDFCDKKEICCLCKLMMFCLPAGVRENNKEFSFLNVESDMNDLIIQNTHSEGDEGSLGYFINNILNKSKSLAEWQLSNTLFINFTTNLENGSKEVSLKYNSLPVKVARTLVKNSNQFTVIQDASLRYTVLNYILENKNLKPLIFIRARNMIKKINSVKSEDFLQLLRISKILENEGESVGMERENVMYQAGQKVRKYYIALGNINKCNSVGYRLLNLIKYDDHKRVMDALFRIIMTSKVKFPSELGKVMDSGIINSDDKKQINLLTYSFINGLVNNSTKEKNAEEKSNQNEIEGELDE